MSEGPRLVQNSPDNLPHPIRRRMDIDWQKNSPRWFLVLMISSLLVAVGAVAAKLDSANDRESQRLAAAIDGAPTQFQLRLQDRVTMNEAEIRIVKASIQDLNSSIKDLNKEIRELTIAMRTRR